MSPMLVDPPPAMPTTFKMRSGDADDLDDGLDYAGPSVRPSGSKIQSGGDDLDDLDFIDQVNGDEQDEDADVQVDWDADDGDPDRIDIPPPTTAGKKRTGADVNDEEEGSGHEQDRASVSDPSGHNPDDAAAEKRKKRRLKDKLRKQAKKAEAAGAFQSTNSAGRSTGPGDLSVPDLDTFLLESLKRTYNRASEVELQDIKVPTSHLMTTAAYENERSLSTLPEFIKTQVPPLPKNLKRPGTPSILILCVSGLRCADVVRSLKTFDPKPPGEITKLFAKHFKVSEQIEHLQKTKCWAAVGTPGRIAKILADSEKRTLLTLNEVRDEFWKSLFGDKKVREKLLQPGVKFGVF